MKKTKVGIIGCGNISGIYLKNCSTMFESLELGGCADIIPEKAKAKASEYGTKAYTIEDLLADPEIRIAVNLTVPAAHFDVTMKALAAGKNVYSEKPFAMKREEARKILAYASEKGLITGGAPDTFMGGGLQTCRKLVDDGWIGKPVAAAAFVASHGPERWHPNSEIFYKSVGPLLDMGPYYLTALITLLGPVKRVAGSAGIGSPERIMTCPERFGDRIKVEVPTHVTGVLDFECGAIGTLITSFDVWDSKLPRIEIYGTEGTLSLPDPNLFEGPVQLKRHDTPEWRDIPLTHGYTANSRGIGIADMASALETGRRPRAGSELTFHVLDVMLGILDSSQNGKHYLPESTCKRPDALPTCLLAGRMD